MGQPRQFKATAKVAPAGLYWMLIAFVGLTFALLGGSSRPDAVQIGILRPLSALLLIPMCYLISKEALSTARIPVLLFGALVIWMIVQLIPLPAALWQSLPDRETIAELDSLAFSQDLWRPISMVPARQINALASLVVVAAAIALPLALKMKERDIFLVIIGLGIADAGLGFLQLITGAGGPFYFYAQTNYGSAVGILANENHSAVFSSLVMLVSMRVFLTPSTGREGPWVKIVSAAAFALGLLSVVISGSRAGFLTGLFALGASVVMVYLFASAKAAARSAKKRGKPRAAPVLRIGRFQSRLLADPRKFGVIVVVAIMAVAALFVLNGRAAGLEATISKDPFDDLRWGLLPVLGIMASKHWFLGTGFGSFEEVYHIYEPTELLRSTYVNQAHNDWAQLVIEGGLPAIIIVLCLLLWIAVTLVGVFRSPDNGRARALFWAASIGVIVIASLPDYPLRTPLFQAVYVWLILALAIETKVRQSNVIPR